MRSITVRPRLQTETWSLYWRESMATETECMPDVKLSIASEEGGDGDADNSTPPPLPAGATVRDALAAAAAACGWPCRSSLVRLEGYELPFERCLARGVEVGLDEPAAKFAAAAEEGAVAVAERAPDAQQKPPPPLVYVRTVLAAEGWRLDNDKDDPSGYSTSDSEDDGGDGA